MYAPTITACYEEKCA